MAIQFSKASSYQWIISPFDLTQLYSTLEGVKNGTRPEVTLQSEIKYDFFRTGSRYGNAEGY